MAAIEAAGRSAARSAANRQPRRAARSRRGAQAGDPDPAYLAPGTYELSSAFAVLRANAKRTGAKLRKAPRGFRAWQDPDSPTSVYLAKPGEDFQVEVYDPSFKEALAVVLSPELRPVPTG
jgi:hypothetical protein